MDTEKIPIPILQGQDCFACGTNNPIGLKMTFYRQDNTVCSDAVLGRDHVGWENMAHGGIIYTLLDEVMSWTVIYFKKCFAVTRRMDVRYLKPVPVEEPLTASGEIVAPDQANTCRVRGLLRNQAGNILARGDGEFFILNDEKLSMIPIDFRNEMEKLFRSFP